MNNLKQKAKSLLANFKSFNWNIFIALCLVALVPAIYQTIRTFLISSTASTQGIDVIGQMEWFDLINETLLAFLTVPLYSILNKIYKYDKDNFSKAIFKTGIVVLTIYVAFNLGVYFYGNHLVKFMNPDEVDIQLVTHYLQLETIAFMIGVIVSFTNVVFVVVGKSKNMYIFLVTSCILSIVSDFLLIPNYGVYGVAYSNILINGIMSLCGVLILIIEKLIKPGWFHKTDLPLFRDWAKVGVFSGGEIFLNNIFYVLMVMKMVNMVAEQGNYWVANNFIWGWLLIPIMSMGEVIKRDCKDGYQNLKQSNYYLLMSIITIIWCITIPTWQLFFKNAQQLENYHEIYLITLKLFPFYIGFGLSMIPDNIFIGLGNTKYNMINSLISNLVYYGIFFILYKTNAITFTMNVIILMFGFGMVFHLIISLVEEKIFLKKEIEKANI